MSAPTTEELSTALTAAGQMREHGVDSFFLAKSLLSCHYQELYLLEILNCAKLYLRNGMSEVDHSRLVKAIEKADKVKICNEKKKNRHWVCKR
ncbi:hypothetical protein MNBD_GAMMA25-1059 [hydrothermal vent metagenome]|uniref:HEPN domain-containing protein n=1 Tax=hydrothermal vent metagenome TaxID=652676 RepID=A0A3B1APE0_9ZZZZ